MILDGTKPALWSEAELSGRSFYEKNKITEPHRQQTMADMAQLNGKKTVMKLVLLAQNLFANGQIELRVLMLGLSKAGKTTLRVELSTGIPLVTKPTVGLEITHVSYLRFNMHVWDMGGQPRFRMYWKKIYIVDSAIGRSLKILQTSCKYCWKMIG